MPDLILRDSTQVPAALGTPAQAPAADIFKPDEESDPLRVFYLLLRRKWIIIGIALAVLIPTALVTFLVTPVYKSVATVQIDPESAKILPYKDVSESVVQDFAVYFKTQQEILGGPALATRVVRKLDLTKHPCFAPGRKMTGLSAWLDRAAFWKSPEPEPAAPDESRLGEDLAEALQVQPVRGSRLIQVTYLSPDPALAASVVNTLAEEFIKLHFETKTQTSAQAVTFLESQLGILKTKVQAAEEALIRYARENGMLNPRNTEQGVIRQRLEQLNEQMTQVDARYIARSANFNSLRDATPEDFPASLKNSVIEKLEERLFEQQQKHASLTARFGENWPEVLQVGREIARVEQQLRDEKQAAIMRALKQASVEYESARQERDMLGRALEDQKNLTNKLNNASVQYNILRREVDTNEQLYEGLLQRMKETGVTAGLEFGNIHVVEPGKVEARAYRPRKALNLALGLILGLALGCGLAFFLDYLDNTVKTGDQVEHLVGLPTLGLIPLVPALEMPHASSNRKQSMVVSLSSNTALARRDVVAPQNKPNWRLWESYRTLRTSILLSSPDRAPRIILVTSSIPHEGKTTTVAHLATAIAQTGSRTLMIDLDMRKRSLTNRFGANGSDTGMSIFLSGNSDLLTGIRETGIPNLFIVGAGPIPPNPAELIGSARMKFILDQSREQFDFVIIDSSPVLTVTDAQIIAARVDGVVLVARAGLTPKEIIRQASKSLRRVGARILGVTLNGIDLQTPEYSYYGRYYMDDSYYSEPAPREKFPSASA